MQAPRALVAGAGAVMMVCAVNCIPDLGALTAGEEGLAGGGPAGGGTASSSHASTSSAGDGGGGSSPAASTSATSATSSSAASSGSGTPECTLDAECPGQSCLSGVCVDRCEDRRRDGTETDIDCGGDTCGPCSLDGICKVNTDCPSTAVCGSGKTCIPPGCTDGLKDQDETDTDCGGVCATASPYSRCSSTKGCSVPSDCQSFLCDSSANKCNVADLTSSTDMIDDMELQSPTRSIIPTAGRVGEWYPFTDGTATATMTGPSSDAIVGGRTDLSKFAMHVSGMGYTTWGAGIGFDLNNASSGSAGKQLYDGSSHTGIKFWLRGDPAIKLRVQLVDLDTYDNPMAPATATLCTKCDDHFGAFVNVTSQWTLYKVSFTGASQQGFGAPAVTTGFNPKQMISVQFQVIANTTFDYWVDDIAFYE